MVSRQSPKWQRLSQEVIFFLFVFGHPQGAFAAGAGWVCQLACPGNLLLHALAGGPSRRAAVPTARWRGSAGAALGHPPGVGHHVQRGVGGVGNGAAVRHGAKGHAAGLHAGPQCGARLRRTRPARAGSAAWRRPWCRAGQVDVAGVGLRGGWCSCMTSDQPYVQSVHIKLVHAAQMLISQPRRYPSADGVCAARPSAGLRVCVDSLVSVAHRVI